MRRHAGIALVTALLVVAIATLTATALLTTSNIALHRTAALRDSEQAWWVARGVESWVLGILQQDLEDTRGRDGFNEPWALPVDYLPVDNGFVRGQVVDLQGRFNLNNLLPPDPATGGAPRQGGHSADKARKHEQHFERLLKSLTSTEVPPGLLVAIKDWMDGDQTPGFPTGAEDMAYLSLKPPYRAANRLFTVVSELLAVQGVTPELYAALRPLLCALPQGTEINVNTAPVEILQTMSERVDSIKLQEFVARRVEKPAESTAEVSDLFNHPDAPPWHVKTEYFQIQGEVFVGSSRVALYSLIHRPESGPAPTVLAHAAEAE